MRDQQALNAAVPTAMPAYGQMIVTTVSEVKLCKKCAREHIPHKSYLNDRYGLAPQIDKIFRDTLADDLPGAYYLEMYEKIKENASEVINTYRDPKAAIQETIKIAKREGKWFVAYAIFLELMEDVGGPIIVAAMGHPEIIPILIAWHSEPITWPLYFIVRKIFNKKMSPEEFKRYFGEVEKSILAESSLERKIAQGAFLKKRVKMHDVMDYFKIRLTADFLPEKASTLERIGMRETAAKTLARLVKKYKVEKPKTVEEKAIYELLVHHIDDPDDWVRRACVGGLGKMLNPDSIPILIKLVDDGDVQLSAASIRALTRFGSCASLAVQKMIDIISSEDNFGDETARIERVWLKLYALECLGYIASDARGEDWKCVKSALMPYFTTAHVGLRSAALESLGRIGVYDEEITEILRNALRDHDPYISEIALWSLSRRYLSGDHTMTKAGVKGALLRSAAKMDSKMREFSCALINRYSLNFELSIDDRRNANHVSADRYQKAKVRARKVIYRSANDNERLYALCDALREEGNTVLKTRDFHLIRSTRPLDEMGHPLYEFSLNRERITTVLKRIKDGLAFQQPIIDVKRGKEARWVSVVPQGDICIVGPSNEIREFADIVSNEAPCNLL